VHATGINFPFVRSFRPELYFLVECPFPPLDDSLPVLPPLFSPRQPLYSLVFLFIPPTIPRRGRFRIPPCFFSFPFLVGRPPSAFADSFRRFFRKVTPPEMSLPPVRTVSFPLTTDLFQVMASLRSLLIFCARRCLRPTFLQAFAL